MVNKVISISLVFTVLLSATSVAGQVPQTSASPSSTGTHAPSVSGGESMQLSVPLLRGSAAPFDGLLITEQAAASCIEAQASARRWQLTSEADTQLREQSAHLYEQFITEQNSRIQQLSQHSWWDDNGNAFMLGLGFLLGIALTAVIVAVSH